MTTKKYLKSLVALAICFSMALLPIMQVVSAQTTGVAPQLTAAETSRVNALNTQISSNMNTYAQQLTTNTAFTTTPASISGTIPSSEGATYFSIDVGGTSLYNGVITLGSVTGYIWAANGTFLYTYEAWIDPTTLQIVNVTVYPFESSGFSNTAPPSIAGINVYTIGEPNTPVQQVYTVTTTTSASQSVSPTWYQDTPANWSGFSVQTTNSMSYMESVTMSTNVVQVSTGSYGPYTYMGVASWDGMGNTQGGTPILYQGGWEAIGDNIGNIMVWSYTAWVEDAPSPQVTAPWNVYVGDTVTCTVTYAGGVIVDVTVTDGSNQFTRGFICTGSDTPMWAQFVVEDPTTNGNVDRLAGWSGDINQVGCMATYDYNGVNYPAPLSWYYPSGYSNWVHWLMVPWPSGIQDATTTYSASTNTMSTVYNSSD